VDLLQGEALTEHEDVLVGVQVGNVQVPQSAFLAVLKLD
jgi:translation elongation factor EF-4